MSSWLGGLSSGLEQVGGSLSSFTGQISNFTKDMLLEGVEEVGDSSTQLQVSISKLEESETAFATQKYEYDKLKKLHLELEEKLEASEIQIKRQSEEYRSHLQQKDVEISHLKAQQSNLKEEVRKLHESTQPNFTSPALLPVVTSSSTTTSSAESPFLSHPPVSHRGFHSDQVDFSDVIWSQQEINRLSTEVLHLEAEVARWRRMSEMKATAAGSGSQEDILKLHQTNKDLWDEVSREQDAHRYELAALQDAQRQKISDITRRHQLELAKYEERVEQLEEQIQNGSGEVRSPSEIFKLRELQETIQMLQEAAEQREVQLTKLSTSLEEAQRKQVSLQLEKEEALEENTGLLQNYTRLQASVTELQTRVQEQEEKALERAHLENEIQKERQSLTAAEKEIDRLNSLLQAKPIEEVEHADILELNTIIGTIKEEKEWLQKEKNGLQARLQVAEERLQVAEGKLVSKCETELSQVATFEDLQVELERGEKALRTTENERDTLKSELEELDRQNQEATQHLISVKEQLSKQLGESKTELTRVTAELNKTRDQKRALEQELEMHTDQNSCTAFGLNDLHMSGHQLEKTIKDLREKLSYAQEQSQDAHREVTELRKVLQDRDKQLTELEQLKQYQQTINEFSRAQSMDATPRLTEHKCTIKMKQEKDPEMADVRHDFEQASDYGDTNKMLPFTVEGQVQLSTLLQEKDAFIETLKQNAADLHADMENNLSVMKRDAENLKHLLEEKDKQLGGMKEENSHLKEEIDRLRDQQSRPQPQAEPRTLDIITELEAEIIQLKSSRNSLEEEVHVLKTTLEEKQSSLLLSQQALQAQQNELEQVRSHNRQTALNYDRLIHAKDEEIRQLQQSVKRLSESHGLQQGEMILQENKTPSLNQENNNEKHDLSKAEIERLVRGIKEKETEISQLNEKNMLLTKQLDQVVVSHDEIGKLSQMVLQKDIEIQELHARVSMGGGPNQDVLFLQQQLQAFAVEREQVLAVLNEKAKENSQLRSDHHRLMDILTGKEAALMKLQQENLHLSNMSDPSGSQEMFKETIQNLSRIIREKDIEIDALTQKCQTLVTVLQASGGGPDTATGGVSSNQFEELLQERDMLKQQVKKMEEWKQQVITTVRNMQHESAQLQEELINLQSEVSADNDCSTKLSVDYTRLIQSYEQKEKRLGSLSLELAQVQQTITQLNSTKEVLLSKLDRVAQSPESIVVPSCGPLHMVEVPKLQETFNLKNEKLNEELEQLQVYLSDKEKIIQKLKEENQKLSTLGSASENEQRSQAEDVRQIKDRLEAIQRSVREKDLLIKAKGDQLTQVSESLHNRENDNEVLRQAVTNLREQALILEMDRKKLIEQNELVTARSQEKESEFRALQETNMQVSLLLREREFELGAISEKAATVERMLKDKEQGKSGELNQLLNEMKSMQEKAVMFQQERDQVMIALKQKQMETTAVQSELQHMRDKEHRLNLELERLRSHLLEIEDSYTREALAAEEREAELRRKVVQLNEKLAISSNAVENASQQAIIQVESLQEQLTRVVKQRDEAMIQLNTSQGQVNQYAVSLSNLQMVLEQFQQEEKAMYSAELEKLNKEKEEWMRRALTLEDQASALQLNLNEANAALDSASRLTDQLDMKEEHIEELKKEVAVRQEMLEDAQKKLINIINSTEGKIDKVLVRNLFLGYFHTPKAKRVDVLRLMGSVLGLSREEVDHLLEEDTRHGVTGWVSSWLGGRGGQSVPNTPQRPTSVHVLNLSFSEMFVKFLEMESTPSLPAPKLPFHNIKPLSAASSSSAGSSTTLDAAANKRPAESNPFLAPRSAAVPLLSGSGTGSSGALLMKPITDALPTFTPVPVSAEASAGAVLKDLLKQ